MSPSTLMVLPDERKGREALHALHELHREGQAAGAKQDVQNQIEQRFLAIRAAERERKLDRARELARQAQQP